MSTTLRMAAAMLLAMVPWAGRADDNARQAGDFTIYFNALTTDALPASQAQAYGLPHSARQGLVVVSVSHGSGAASTEVPATVTGTASTLLGAPVKLTFRNVDDGGHPSTLGTFTVPGPGTVRFDLMVRPEGGPATPLQFTHDYAGP